MLIGEQADRRREQAVAYRIRDGTTLADFEAWGDYLGDPPLAMAFLNRIVVGAIIVKINGKSYRAHRAHPASPGKGDQAAGRSRNVKGH